MPAISQTINGHILIIGHSAAGRSAFPKGDTEGGHVPEYPRLSVTFAAEAEAEASADEKRLQAVRQAYWDCTAEDEHDIYILSDALSEYAGVDAPTHAQKKVLFDMLPAHLIGKGISWGFSDTEVRDAICEFVEENVADVRAQILPKE